MSAELFRLMPLLKVKPCEVGFYSPIFQMEKLAAGLDREDRPGSLCAGAEQCVVVAGNAACVSKPWGGQSGVDRRVQHHRKWLHVEALEPRHLGSDLPT